MQNTLWASNSSDLAQKGTLMWPRWEKGCPRRPSGGQKSSQDSRNGVKIEPKLIPNLEKYVTWIKTIFWKEISSGNIEFSWYFVSRNIEKNQGKTIVFNAFSFLAYFPPGPHFKQNFMQFWAPKSMKNPWNFNDKMYWNPGGNLEGQNMPQMEESEATSIIDPTQRV